MQAPASEPVRDGVVRLYAELTGLDVLSVRAGTRMLDEEPEVPQPVAVFECKQVGEVGTLTYHLMTPMSYLTGVEGAEQADHFTYQPGSLDPAANASTTVSSQEQELPAFLQDEIDFERPMARLFFLKTSNCLVLEPGPA
jgi:hypothetical protein